MATRSIIEELIESIKENNEDAIARCSKFVIKNITEVSKEPRFYSIPIDQFSKILKGVDFVSEDSIKEPFILLQTIIQKTSEVHEKEAILLLNEISPNLKSPILSILSQSSQNVIF